MSVNRGYVGWSESVRSAEAKKDGKLPLTHAVKAVAALAKVTQREAREALASVGPCEWHHTSKKFNKTDFYHVGAACFWLECRAELANLPTNWRAEFSASIKAKAGGVRPSAFAAYGATIGVAGDILEIEYYRAWQSTVNELDEYGREPTLAEFREHMKDD